MSASDHPHLIAKLPLYNNHRIDYSIRNLARCPSPKELRACFELCRLHNNLGLWTTWLPTAWSILMAYHATPSMSLPVAFFYILKYIPLCLGVKSLIMTIDDILDADVDAHVARTATRPIPRGAISLPRAWLFFTLQVVVGVAAAFRYMSPRALWLAIPVWPLFIAYPTFKRWMDFAPIPLGFMLKVGAVLGWADVLSSLPASDSRAQSADVVDWSVVGPLYLAAVLWTVAYETVYQHMDKEDDVKLGVRSLALYLGRHTILVCILCSIGFFALLGVSGAMNAQGLLYFAGISCAAAFLLWDLVHVDIDEPLSCRDFFWNTPKVGGMILGGLVLDVVFSRLNLGLPL